MPRYSLKRSPWTRITSPGDSSVPASIDPSITRVGAGGDRLGDVARRGDAAVGDHRHPCRIATSAHVEDRRDLRHADARDDAGRADRAGPDADLEAVGAGVDQRLGRLGGRDVAGDHLDVPLRLDPPHHLDDRARVAVRRVDDDHVDLGGDERRGALERIGADADGGADAQPAPLVLRRERVLARASGCP